MARSGRKASIGQGRRQFPSIERSGLEIRGGRALAAAPVPPDEVTVVERVGSDEDGVPLVRPLAWPRSDPAPVLRIVETGLAEPFPTGARAAAQLVRRETGEIEARITRVLGPANSRVVGVFYRGFDGGKVVPVDRRNRAEYRVMERDAGGTGEGEVVVVEESSTAKLRFPRARIVQRLGHSSDAGVISLLAIATHEIPTEFPIAAIAEAEAVQPATLAGRTDLRGIPLVTIDGSDARDFDDAVWAEPDTDPGNRGGWHLVVAIADVAWYVRAGSALDREAMRRGNSVYFPDCVVPMLPETLSNDLCSLIPGADRPCLAVHLWIDATGRKREHRFERGMMRSAARLTYEEVQAAHEGSRASPLPQERLAALYGAFAALAQARATRGALELEIGEHRVVLDAERQPAAIIPAARLDSHRLIEEFMVLANVAAAEELEMRRQPCIYRVHDAPDPEKLGELRAVLAETRIVGPGFAKGEAPQPELFNRVLRRASATPVVALVNQLVLRCQAQAVYSPDNIGHFGLALRRYAHFTSPIRRYADLIVHRALITGASAAGRDLGTGALAPGTTRDQLATIADHISTTERRAAAAERSAIERYRATFLARSVGAVFTGHISGVAEFGLFVSLADNGAEGLVPLSTLAGDAYKRDARRQRLIGRSGRVFRIGDEVSVRLVEADGIGGRLIFHIQEEGTMKRIAERSRSATRRRPRRHR